MSVISEQNNIFVAELIGEASELSQARAEFDIISGEFDIQVG